MGVHRPAIALFVAHALGCSGTQKPGGERGEDFTGTDGLDTAAEVGPVVTLISPLASTRLYADQEIAFQGTVTDNLDDVGDLQVFWNSDQDGMLDLLVLPDSGGAFVNYGYLTQGVHSLVLTAIDRSENESSATETVTVGSPNTAPGCEIVVPEDGATGEPEEVVYLTGIVSDAHEPADALSVVWSSDLDGVLGRPTPSTDGSVVLNVSSFSVGVHQLELKVTDELGKRCVDHVTYTVGSNPIVSIVEPLDGASSGEGEALLLSGTVADASDRLSVLEVSWQSDVDGLIWSGLGSADGTVRTSVSDLSIGTHGITLTATDPAGLSDSETVYVQVDAKPTQPTVGITPRPATSADDLVAIIATPSEDLEDAEIVYAYRWFRAGEEFFESTGTTVPASATTRGEEWRVVVTPNDGVSDGPAGEAVTTIVNTPPRIGTVRLEPESATTGDDLSCNGEDITDEDGDAVGVSISWSIDGVVVDETSAMLASGWTARGNIVACSMTPSDDEEDGAAVTSNTVVVGNSAPAIAGVLISPDALFAGDTPTCSAIGFEDADGDSDASGIIWTINGAVVSTDARLTEPFIRGDEVACTITPSDGTSDGTPVSASITVSNSAPSMLVAEMLPWPAIASDILRCTGWGYSDPDGDDDDSFVEWSVDGGIVGIGGSLSGMFAGGSVVTCTITPSDGMDEGEPVSITQTIGNSVPTIEGVEITPPGAGPGDTLTCATVGYSDPDGDPEASTMIWLVNDFEVTGETDWELDSGFDSGDRVTCRVTVSDGRETGLTHTKTITIGNDPPSITSISLGPSPLGTDDVAIATVTTEDEDGDSVTLSYSWSVNGDVVPESGHTLDGRVYFDRDDVIWLTVTPSDGTATGEPVVEGPRYVVNTPPAAPTVVIEPEDPIEGEDGLFCDVVLEGLDADGDAVTHTVTWTADDESYTDTETTVRTGDTIGHGIPAGNEEWVCTVQTHDGMEPGAMGSASVVIVPTLGRSEAEPAESCRHLKEEWSTAVDGIYWIDPLGVGAFQARCDMETDGGGWTLVAYAPSNRGAPESFLTPDAADPSACLDLSDFCMLETDTINGILYRGADTTDRFRLVAADLPMHTHYYWNTEEDFDPTLSDPDSTWWSAALSFGGEHSGGCLPEGGVGLGHDPASDCSIGAGESHRIFWAMADGEVTGADSESTFAWYAR